jgi:hypothetical protein
VSWQPALHACLMEHGMPGRDCSCFVWQRRLLLLYTMTCVCLARSDVPRDWGCSSLLKACWVDITKGTADWKAHFQVHAVRWAGVRWQGV